MKRKNNLCNIGEKIDLWKHCFGDVWEYDSLEKVVSIFDIVAEAPSVISAHGTFGDNFYYTW